VLASCVVSTWYSAVVRCPSCGVAFEGRFLRGANAMRAPELRTAALENTLNRPACPQCGQRADTDASVVYADPGGGDWIFVAHHGELARWQEVEQSALAAFHASLDTAAEIPMTHVRVVFDLDELRERLAIWDAGFDDAVVDCAKLSALGERPTLRGANERLRFAHATADALVMHVVRDGHPDVTRATFSISRTVVGTIASDATWRARFPALFDHGFVSVDRYLR
jgi:CpXC protein